MKQGTHYFHVPELDITEQKRKTLVERFRIYQKFNRGGDWYENANGTTSKTFNYYPSGESTLKNIFNDEQVRHMRDICKSVPGDPQTTEPFDFLHCQGEVFKHKDELRSAVITVPLLLDNDHGLQFWNDEGTEMIDYLQYDYKTYIFNSKILHGVNTSVEPRLFWQGSVFDQVASFEHIRKQYESGQLFKD